MTELTPPHPKLDELIAVLERLRAPGGCAWDREQTHESLVQYLVEEAPKRGLCWNCGRPQPQRSTKCPFCGETL